MIIKSIHLSCYLAYSVGSAGFSMETYVASYDMSGIECAAEYMKDAYRYVRNRRCQRT